MTILIPEMNNSHYEYFIFFIAGIDRLCTSESDICRGRILMYKDGLTF